LIVLHSLIFEGFSDSHRFHNADPYKILQKCAQEEHCA